MKIVSSTLGMDASAVYRDVSKNEALLSSSGGGNKEETFRLELSELATTQTRSTARLERSNIQAVSEISQENNLSSHVRTEETVIGAMVSEFIGSRVQIRDLNVKQGGFRLLSTNEHESGGGRRGISSGSGLQISLGMQNIRYQHEKMSVHSAGTIVTGDGREINLQMQLMFERVEVSLQRSLGNVLSSRFIDPLVLNFTDGVTVLGDSTFSFDLDCDGEMEEISSLKSGSGFLVFDKNCDGIINNGRELFGPLSGAGYDELKIFDNDQNDWIDENDPVFDQLQLWMGAGGEDGTLVTLREAGVGALSLASVDAHFNLKDRGGRILGQLSRAGLFLTEDGAVRPLMELDLQLQEENEPAGTFGGTPELRAALDGLRDMIAERRRRVAYLASMQFREKETERQKDWLLQRLWELRDDKMTFTG
jgi:hypothetical protein